MGKKIQDDKTLIEQLTDKIALHTRLRFAKRSEQITSAQCSLLETDLKAIEAEMNALRPEPAARALRQQPSVLHCGRNFRLP
jgi:transposase